MMMASRSSNSTVPYRQIRALYDDQTITVYQAYSAAIATLAVEKQKLSASPEFSFTRMTWIKPSWCWMMYRSGYSFKDEKQERILALKMKHEDFLHLLSFASVTSGGKLTNTERAKLVRVQWDPERSPSLAALPYRSIQIGISKAVSEMWVKEWIASIEDVTPMARALKQTIDEGYQFTTEELIQLGLLPKEEVYEISDDLKHILRVDSQ